LSEEGHAEYPITRLISPESAMTPLVLIPSKYEQLRAARTARGRLNRQQWMVCATMVISEVLLALVLWSTISTLRGVWGHAELSEMTEISIAAMAPVTTAWVGLRMLLGMYPGYGLDAVEQLRRHTHATFATLALLAISVMSFQILYKTCQSEPG
jgi:hypothetical protein